VDRASKFGTVTYYDQVMNFMGHPTQVSGHSKTNLWNISCYRYHAKTVERGAAKTNTMTYIYVYSRQRICRTWK